MKLGLMSSILFDFSFEQVVDFMAEAGLASVEFASWPVGKAERRYAGVTHVDADGLDAAKADYINGYMKDKGVELAALCYAPNPLTPDPAQRDVYFEHIKKTIKAAGLLGVKNVDTFIGKDHSVSISDNMESFKKLWPDIIKFAEDEGVVVCFENCPMYFSMDEWPGGKNLASFPKIWREMFSIIDSKYFGMVYDPSHLVWQRMDYIKPIYEFKDKIRNVHLKDAKFLQDRFDDVGILATPLEYHLPKLPGLGDVDWGKFVSALTDVGFKYSAFIEVEDRAFEDSLQDRLDSILISRNYMNQFIL